MFRNMYYLLLIQIMLGEQCFLLIISEYLILWLQHMLCDIDQQIINLDTKEYGVTGLKNPSTIPKLEVPKYIIHKSNTLLNTKTLLANSNKGTGHDHHMNLIIAFNKLALKI